MKRKDAINLYNSLIEIYDKELEDTHFMMDIGSTTKRGLAEFGKKITERFIKTLEELEL